MIQLTDNAVDAVRSAILAAKAPVEGIRIMVEAGGCSGLKYMMGLVSAGEPDDNLVERGGLKLFVDPASGRHLDGTIMDFVTNDECRGFTFENPNSSRCGSCSKSCG